MLPLRKVEIRRLFERAAAEHPPRAEVAFLLQSMEDPRNVGSIFRIADACGAREIVFTGKTPTPPHEEIDRTSRGHDRRVPWRRIPAYDEAGRALKAEGYQLVALETAQGAQCYLDFAYAPRVCLVLGNETKGVYPATLGLCDGAVFVPMYGKGPSMNVHVAAALVAYQAIIGARPGEAGTSGA
ncbi:MAG: TrmH family RNA methyltransferase [Gemmatimonadota bacterium]